MKGLTTLTFTRQYYELSEKLLLNQDVNKNNTAELSKLYEGIPRQYWDLEDFDHCKEQLITLLDCIIDKTKIQLFQTLKSKVLNLQIDSNKNSIQIYLNRIKQALEDNFIFINKNHHRVDKVKVNNFIVYLCDSGAESNLMIALTYFRLSSIELLVLEAKRDLIDDLALRFIRKNHLLNENEEGSHVGDEIHYANGLFNSVADKENLIERIDSHIPRSDLFDMHIEIFSGYLKEAMTIESLLTSLITLLPPPVTKVLNSRQNRNEFDKGYSDLKDYMELWGYYGLPKKEYKKLYEILIFEDEVEIRPRSSLEIFYSMVVALWLEERKIISGVTREIGGLKIFDNGHYILTSKVKDGDLEKGGDSEEILAKFSTSEIVFLYFHPDVLGNNEFRQRLLEQLDAEALLNLYLKVDFTFGLNTTNLEMIRQGSLCALFTKPSLPESVLLTLVNCLDKGDEIPFYKYVLSHPSDCLKQNFKYYSEQFDLVTKLTIFKEALQNNLYNVVNVLLTNQFKKELENEKIYPLYIAAKSGAFETIGLLLNSGFNADDRKNWGGKSNDRIPPLYAAIQAGFYQSAILLSQYAKDIQMTSGWDNVFNFFERYQNSLSYLDPRWNNVLILAAQKGYIEVVKLLLAKNINPNLKNFDGETALLLAVKYNAPRVTEILSSCPVVNPNLKNYAGEAPLTYVVENENIELLKQLLKSDGLNLSIKNKNKETCLFIAIRKNNITILRHLLINGANFNEGMLSNASYFRSLTATASENVKNHMEAWIADKASKGHQFLMKPIDLARILEFRDIVDLLLKYLDNDIILESESIDPINYCRLI